MNERNFGPVSPTTGLEEWDRLPKWAVLVPDVVRAPTVYKTGLGVETDGTQQLAQQLVPQETAGNIQTQESGTGSPISVRPLQA